MYCSLNRVCGMYFFLFLHISIFSSVSETEGKLLITKKPEVHVGEVGGCGAAGGWAGHSSHQGLIGGRRAQGIRSHLLTDGKRLTRVCVTYRETLSVYKQSFSLQMFFTSKGHKIKLEDVTSEI